MRLFNSTALGLLISTLPLLSNAHAIKFPPPDQADPNKASYTSRPSTSGNPQDLSQIQTELSLAKASLAKQEKLILEKDEQLKNIISLEIFQAKEKELEAAKQQINNIIDRELPEMEQKHENELKQKQKELLIKTEEIFEKNEQLNLKNQTILKQNEDLKNSISLQQLEDKELDLKNTKEKLKESENQFDDLLKETVGLATRSFIRQAITMPSSDVSDIAYEDFANILKSTLEVNQVFNNSSVQHFGQQNNIWIGQQVIDEGVKGYNLANPNNQISVSNEKVNLEEKELTSTDLTNGIFRQLSVIDGLLKYDSNNQSLEKSKANTRALLHFIRLIVQIDDLL